MKKIIIISGDPNSINSIIFKVEKNKQIFEEKIYLISNYDLILDQSKTKFFLKISKLKSINDKKNELSLKILDVNLKYKNPFDVPFKESSKFVNKSLNFAHNLSMDKNVLGLVNCPIDKKLLLKKMLGLLKFYQRNAM